ncbi:hypothetical protein BV22DRAFT_1195811 [Leucogyrophana mollusca]|uniref:Uncharacterized protein n=1 Tax=Leucogyrophana mollusca TaxID=85980 RepID=A0ACB8BFE0_9AGAM|nr:hypothetical protein BV22DRAFT_1195811 [Leucogyrophana mollusca]
MGNSASSSGRGHHDDSVDYGYLSPQGVYTGPRDWNHSIVTQFIVDRKLAPFYRPLEDYNDDWDDEQIMAARRELPESSDSGHSDVPATRTDSRDLSKPNGQPKRPGALKEPSRCPEAAVYRGAVECPICFLYYPSNINRSRCCDQSICTECFVQIKRTEPTATHMVSEPAACPYCVQDNFGVVYTPPSWRAGIGSEGTPPPSWPDSPKGSQHNVPSSSAAHKRRRKSFGHDSPDVVTTDQIRPDWEAKLAAVRAAVARRANRRIIMRQVGDRLIPVGVTSGRVHALPTEDGQDGGDNEGRGSRRSRRHPRSNGNSDLSQLLGQMGLGGQDLEELMIMEAMRLSLLDHEEQQRKEAEEKRKKDAAQNANGEASSEAPPSTAPTSGSSSTPESLSMTSPSIATGGRSTPSGRLAADSGASRSRSLTPVSGNRTPSPNRTVVGASNDTSSVSSQVDSEHSGASAPSFTVGNGEAHSAIPVESTITGTYSVLPDSLSMHHTDTSAPRLQGGLPMFSVDPTATPGAASFASSIFTPDSPGEPMYNVLPSSPDEPMGEPLLHVPSLSTEAGAHPSQ